MKKEYNRRVLNCMIFKPKELSKTIENIDDYISGDRNHYYYVFDYIYSAISNSEERIGRGYEAFKHMLNDSKYSNFKENTLQLSYFKDVETIFESKGYDMSFINQEDNVREEVTEVLNENDLKNDKITNYYNKILMELSDNLNYILKNNGISKIKPNIIEIYKILVNDKNFVLTKENYNNLSKIIFSSCLQFSLSNMIEYNYLFNNLEKIKNKNSSKELVQSKVEKTKEEKIEFYKKFKYANYTINTSVVRINVVDLKSYEAEVNKIISDIYDAINNYTRELNNYIIQAFSVLNYCLKLTMYRKYYYGLSSNTIYSIDNLLKNDIQNIMKLTGTHNIYEQIVSTYDSLENEYNESKNNIEEVKEEKEKKEEPKESKIIISTKTNKELESTYIKKIIAESFLNNDYVNETKLLSILSKSGYNLSIDELRRYVNEVKSYINLKTYKNYNFQNGVVNNYSLWRGSSRENIIPFSFNIKPNSSIKILFKADVHNNVLSTVDDLKHQNELYNEYCAKNGILCIADLGDNVESEEGMLMDVVNFSDRLLEANEINDKNIPVLMLGGNHDKVILHAGFDMLEYLSQNSNNIVNLGYEYNNLEFNKDVYYLIHPNSSYLFVDSLENYDNLINTINNFISELSQKRDPYGNKNVVGVASGHFHRRFFSPENGISLVGNGIDGCIQVEYNFDENCNLKEIIIYPINMNNNKLDKINCPILQKIK